MVDIRAILKEQGENIILEDLEYFETELATNSEYSREYKEDCYYLINRMREWKKSESYDSNIYSRRKSNRDESVGIISVGLEKKANSLLPNSTPKDDVTHSVEDIIKKDIESIRETSTYKKEFKKYIKSNKDITADYIDKNFSFFFPWEIDAIVSVKELPEEFIEKYFGTIDLEKVARYQLFSEAFFMKHYSQLDPEIVLLKGKNSWKTKENRSKQLDVFLRLKGVKY